MRLETRALEKNPVFRTARWAMNIMKNRTVIMLSLLVTGLTYLLLPMGNMNATVIIAAIALIVTASINIYIHLSPWDRTGQDVFWAVVNGLLIAFAVFCLISPGTIEPIVRYLFALVTIVTNIINIRDLWKLERRGNWKFYLGVGVAVVMIGFGIGLMVAGERAIESMQQILGAFLTVNALINLGYIIRINREVRKMEQEIFWDNYQKTRAASAAQPDAAGAQLPAAVQKHPEER